MLTDRAIVERVSAVQSGVWPPLSVFGCSPITLHVSASALGAAMLFSADLAGERSKLVFVAVHAGLRGNEKASVSGAPETPRGSV